VVSVYFVIHLLYGIFKEFDDMSVNLESARQNLEGRLRPKFNAVYVKANLSAKASALLVMKRTTSMACALELK
jgi:hypothetical protein